MDHRTGSLHGFDRDRDAYREGEPFDDDKLRDNDWDLTTYDYQLADGEMIYQQCRYDKRLRPRQDAPNRTKRFLPRRPVKKNAALNEDFVFGPGDRRVIYKWPAIMRAGPGATVFVTEGEKNADDVAKAGLLATTVISHRWAEECASALSGRHVIVLEDHDDDGKKLAAAAREALLKVAASIRVVPAAHLWKHLDPKRAPLQGDDVSDWLRHGGDPKKLIEICREVPAEGEITAEPYDFPAERDILPYQWLLGYHLLRGEVVCTAALSGLGKSSLSIVEALSMASAKALLHDQVQQIPLKVMLINLEDNRNTMDKRIAAAMKHHKLTPQDIGGRLIVKAKGELRIKVATIVRNVVVRNELIIAALKSIVIEHQIDVLSIDSFIRSHGVSENDNNAVEQVIECYEDVAAATNCGIHLWHHFRKTNGDGASIDSARGAKALVDALRSVRIMEAMTKEEASQLKLEDARHYFRSFSGKRNFAPPSDQSDWYHLASVEIDNCPPLFGEQVGVVEKWSHPGKQPVQLSPQIIRQVMDEVGTAPKWRDYPTADMWVGKVVARVLCLDREEDLERVKRVVKELKKIGALKEVATRDGSRRERTFVVAGDWVAPAF
jgi:AAA domain-containing protein